ncbi:MAG: uroporphyrinogen-III synthase [Pseudomonadota bacterium]
MPETRIGVLVTRPEPGATRLAEELKQAGSFDVFKAPLLRIESTGASSDAGDATALLLTSPQAVPYTAHLQNLPTYTVGGATAQVAGKAGLNIAFVGHGSADSALIEAVPQGTNLLHLSGVHLATDLAPAFESRNVNYRRVAVYEAKRVETLPQDAFTFLGSEGTKFVTLLSARTVEVFAELALKAHKDAGAPPLIGVCASERIAAAARACFPFSEIAVTASTGAAGFIDFLSARRT